MTRTDGTSAPMDLDVAQQRSRETGAPASTPESARQLTTFAVRHRSGLDVAFLLDGTDGDFQIGMGAASEDFRSVLTIGVDQQRGRLRAVSEWMLDGRSIHVPVRILHRSPTAILVEAARRRDEAACRAEYSARVPVDIPILADDDAVDGAPTLERLTAIDLHVLAAVDGIRDLVALAAITRRDVPHVSATIDRLRACGVLRPRLIPQGVADA